MSEDLKLVEKGSETRAEKDKKEKGWPVWVKIVLLIGVLAVLGLSYAYYILPETLPWNESTSSGWLGDMYDPMQPDFGINEGSSVALGSGADSELASWENDEVFAVLMMGFDYNYPGRIREGGGLPGRPDAIMLLILPKDRQAAIVVSIPRDTLVPLDSYGSEERINALFRDSNPARVTNAVHYLTGIAPDRWVSIDFKGFVDVVDRLGGVDMLVEDDMYIWDDLNGRYFFIPKGLQHMDGATSLMYVRFRGDAMGDINRTSRQIRFLKTLASQAVQWNTVGEVSGIISDVKANFKTDMSEGEAMALGLRLLKIGVPNLDGFTVPGAFEGPYWRPDLEATRKLIERAVTGSLEDSSPEAGF